MLPASAGKAAAPERRRWRGLPNRVDTLPSEPSRGLRGILPEPDTITHLLAEVRAGHPGSLDRLVELVYDDLKRRAHFQLAGASHTLDTTALVHEAYVKLTSGMSPEWEDRTHFFRLAARAMRHILIDRARHHLAQRRGGGAAHVDLDAVEVAMPSPDAAAETIMALDEALSRLAEQSPRLAQVVELRFFGGLPVDETAAALGVAERTVKRDWRLARAFLQEALSGDGRP